MPTRVGTVLLVDDSAELRRIVRKQFEKAGFAIVGEAENGSAAIALAIQHRPDLIILDLTMPVMNGFEATPELLRILPNAIIILFTVFADSSSIQKRALALGIRCVVSKTDLTTLISQSEDLLDNLK